MKLLKYLTIFFTSVVLLACSSVPKTDIDPTVDFSEYKTFAWQPATQASSRSVKDPVYDSPLFEKKLEKAVADAMFSRGFSGSETPDILLSYHMADEKRRNIPFGVSVGYGRYSRNSYWNIFAPQFRNLQRDEVLVIIDATDAETSDLVWRGWTKTRKRSSPVSVEEANRLANKIMSAFPK